MTTKLLEKRVNSLTRTVGGDLNVYDPLRVVMIQTQSEPLIDPRKRRTSSGEVELMQKFLAKYALDWLAASGLHSIFYDGDGAVAAVSIEFEGVKEAAPHPEEVLGKSVEASTDGSIYDRVRRPEDGYWICYSRTSGNNPVVTITVQRINLHRY